jgi:predicted O-methyltransferase YrrM
MIRLAFHYLRYILFARHRKGHGIHSPFVFSFINEVLLSKDDDVVKKLNRELSSFKRDKRKISTINFGAGTIKHSSSIRTIGSIVKNSSIQAKYGKLLYKLIQVYKPESILELGTGIGIATSWMAAANAKAEICTVDADLMKLNVAKEIHQNLGLKNINYVNEKFDDFLKKFQVTTHPLLAFIDGNHSYEATLNYYNSLLRFPRENTIMIFDDINWSLGMKKAWNEIVKNNRSVICIDLFFIGIVFFKKGIPKQAFSIKF